MNPGLPRDRQGSLPLDSFVYTPPSTDIGSGLEGCVWGYAEAAVFVSFTNCIIPGVHKTVANDAVGPWLACRSVVLDIQRSSPSEG